MQKCPMCKMHKVVIHTTRDQYGHIVRVEAYCTNCQSVIQLHKGRKN